jgi:hypothetical protein
MQSTSESDNMRRLDEACLRLSMAIDKRQHPSMDKPTYSDHVIARKGTTLLIVKGRNE